MTPTDTGGMWLTLHEAATAFDVSLSTLHRGRRSGELESVGAFKDTDNMWKVPRAGLARLGFTELVPPVSPGQTTIDDALAETVSDTVPEPSVMTPSDTPGDTTVEELQKRLAEAEKRAEIAEAIAAERERLIETQATALRMLEPPKEPALPSTASTPAVQEPEAGEPVPGRRALWRRLWRK